jgi:hypothetical protein
MDRIIRKLLSGYVTQARRHAHLQVPGSPEAEAAQIVVEGLTSLAEAHAEHVAKVASAPQRAAPPPPPPAPPLVPGMGLDDCTKNEMIALAEKHGIELAPKATKAEIRDILDEHGITP